MNYITNAKHITAHFNNQATKSGYTFINIMCYDINYAIISF